MTPIERHTRKQVLLARIAFERIELQRDLAQVQRAAHLPHLLRSVLGEPLGRQLFGSGAATGGGWATLAFSLLRRYRLAATVVGTLMPLLRGGKRLRRLVKWGALGTAAWWGWRAMTRRQDTPR